MSFLDCWSVFRSHSEQTELKLSPQHLERLLSDNGIRSALRCDSVLPLLPPAGSALFRRFTAQSIKDIQHQAEPICPSPCKQETGTDLPKPSYHLEAEKPLPFFYKDPPPEILYTPLEELDPFYQSEKTFLVLSRGNVLHRFSAESSCFILSPLSCLRTASIKVLLHPFLSWFMLATLLTNCVFMVLENTPVSYAMECVFSVIYTCEAVIKVFSRGFCAGRFTLIRDPWNWLDLIVIITAFPALIVEMGKFYVLVTIPRVLKIFSVFPGLRRTVQALLKVVKELANVLLVTLFCLSMLAAISMVFFMGSLRNKCVFWPWDDGNQTNTSINDYHSYVSNPGNHHFHPRSIDPTVCGNVSTARVCPSGSMCLRGGKAPNYGYTSYDWFAPSLLSMFRLLTQDFTENLLQLTIRANGYFSVLGFIFLFLPTCFMLLSHVVAVVAMALVQQEESDFAQRSQTKEVFKQIEELLKSREDAEESSSGAVLPEKKQSSEEEAVSIKETDEDRRPSSCWQRLQQRLQYFILSSVFEWAIIICLIINTIIMATEHFPLSYEHAHFLEVMDLVFTLVFSVEMVLKLLALGIRGYFRVSWHIFDFVLVLLSLVELSLESVQHFSEPLRILILLRTLRLARWWPGLHLFLRVVWSSVQHLTLVLLVLVFLFVMVGLQLFRRDYEENVCHISEDCQLPRWHMNDLFHTFMIVCRILFGQWIETLWDCMEVSSTGLCVLYFILVLVLSKLLLLVLFLHLLLSSITNQRLSSVEEKDKNSLQACINLIETLKQLCGRTGTKDRADTADTKESLTLNLVGAEIQTSEERKEMQGDEQQGPEPEACCCNCCFHCCPFQDLDSSRCLGKVWSNLRRNSLKIVQNKIFEGFVIFIILLSSAALMLEDINLQHSPVLVDVVDWADRAFTLFFVMEMILQWLALGLRQYFTNAWRWIDFIVLDVSLVSLFLDVLGLSYRPLRVFRTLRILSRFKGVRLVLHFLVLALPRLLKTLLVVLLVWLLWALYGVRLFGGKFWYCFNVTSEELLHHSDVENKTTCFMLMMEANQSEITWKNTYAHFDHVPMSYLSLSLLAMSGGWFDILYSAMDSTLIEEQLEYESNIFSFFYFLGFFIVGVFFTFNSFVRTFLHTIYQHRHKIGKYLFMTEDQQRFPEGFKKRFSVKPENHVPRPQNRFQAWIFDLVLSEVFEVFMMVVVVLNLVLVMVETYDDSELKHKLQIWFHFVFLLVFLVEFLLKIIALRRFYFNALNVVDLLVLIVSIVGLFLSDLIYIDVYFFLFLRLARLGRVLRFFRCARGIRTLLLGFMMSLPALLNVGLLLLIIFYTFSVLGAMSFGEVNMDNMFNFYSFWQSMVCMTLVTTSSSWEEFLFPIMISDCKSERADCASPVGGALFFVSYLVLFVLLTLLLFIAVIQQMFNAREESWEFQEKHLKVFVETWKKMDKENTGSIPHSALWELCQALQDGLRVPTVNLFTLIDTNLQGDQLQCEDVLQTLTQQVFGVSLPNEQLRESVKGILPQKEEGKAGEEVGGAKEEVGLA